MGSQTREVRLLRKVPARPRAGQLYPQAGSRKGGRPNPWADPVAGQGAPEASPAPPLQPDNVTLRIWAWLTALRSKAQVPTGFTFWLLGSPAAQAPPALGCHPWAGAGGIYPIAGPPSPPPPPGSRQEAGNARPQGAARDGAL